VTSLRRRVIFAAAFSACGCIAFAQQINQASQKKKSQPEWKEYAYPAYGFAITVPQVPKETPLKNSTQYRLYWDSDADVVVDLDVTSSSTGFCSEWLASARRVLKDSRITSVVTINGTPTVEGDGDRNGLQAGYQREQCINERLYNFEAGWPKDQSKPPVVGRVVSSFRLLPVQTK
jgi:hypothetical protein